MIYTYPKNYKVQSNKQQLAILAKHFPLLPDLNLDQETSTQGEGQFLIPHFKLIAPTYNNAVLKVMEAIKSTRQTYDYRSGNWTKTYLRQLPIKENWYKNQKEEIIILSAQFGQKHTGKSVAAVHQGLAVDELPLGIYECLIMLLTHPERLQDYNDLWIDCPGDEYSWDTDGAFSKAPCLYFSDEVRFDADDVSDVSKRFGSASGFVPQVNFEPGSLAPSEPLTLAVAINFVKENGYKVIKEM